MKQEPVKENSFIKMLGRYWKLVIPLIVFVALACTKVVFNWTGWFIYIPCLVLSASVSALVIRHIVFRRTIDEDIWNRRFEDTWDNKMSDIEKARWSIGVFIALFLGCAIIAAALANGG